MFSNVSDSVSLLTGLRTSISMPDAIGADVTSTASATGHYL